MKAGLTASKSSRTTSFYRLTHMPFRCQNCERNGFHPVASYDPDPRNWIGGDWFDLYSGKPIEITPEGRLGGSATVRVKTYRETLAAYELHPETKALGPDGESCRGRTEGLLRRRPVVAAYLVNVGKESNRLEDVQIGLVHNEEEIVSMFLPRRFDPWFRLVLPVLRRIPVSSLAQASGLDRRTIQGLRNRRVYPRAKTKEILTKIAARAARIELRQAGISAPRGDLSCIAAAYFESVREGVD
jgi:hypothetical protein